MKKLFTLTVLILSTQGVLAYTHKVYNYTLEEVRLKIDQKWHPDKTIVLEPARQKGDTIQPSETMVSTDLGGAACTNGVEARGSTGVAIAQLTGLCLIPFITEKSKGLEINVYYEQIQRSNGKFVGEGMKLEIR